MEENIESKQVPEPGTESGKTFTQEEVNNIVQQRLNREKGKADPEREAALAAKELELEQRELQLKAKEMLSEKGLPKELGGIIRMEDENSLKKAVEMLAGLINANKEQPQKSGFIIGSASDTDRYSGPDPYRKAMRLE